MPYFMLTSPANSFQGRLFYDMSFDSGKHLSNITGTFRTLSASFFFPKWRKKSTPLCRGGMKPMEPVNYAIEVVHTCNSLHLRLHLHRACEPGLIIT